MADEKWYADLVSKIVTKGDVGAAGIGFGIGMILDAALHMTGLIPLGMSGAAGTALGLGIKNAIQAAVSSFPRQGNVVSAEQARTAYHDLRDLLIQQDSTPLLNVLERYHYLWRTGLLTHAEFIAKMRSLVIEPPDFPPSVRKIASSAP